MNRLWDNYEDMMMSNYRIIKYSNEFYESFKVQKKSFLGFWYNFNNIDAYTTGFYDSEKEAKDAIERHRAKITKTVL
jgi:RNase P protein component